MDGFHSNVSLSSGYTGNDPIQLDTEEEEEEEVFRKQQHRSID